MFYLIIKKVGQDEYWLEFFPCIAMAIIRADALAHSRQFHVCHRDGGRIFRV